MRQTQFQLLVGLGLQFRNRIGIALISTLISCFVFLAQPLLVRQTLQNIFGFNPLSASTSDVETAHFDQDQLEDQYQSLLQNCVLLFLNYSILHGLRQFAEFMYQTTGDRIVANVRRDLLHHFLVQGAQYVDVKGQGTVFSILSEDTLHIKKIFSNHIRDLLSGIVFTFGGLALCLYISSGLTLLVAALVLPLGLVAKFIDKRVKKATSQVQAETAEAMAGAADAMHAIKEVEACGTVDLETSKFSQAMESQIQVSQKAAKIVCVLKAAVGALIGGVLVGVIWGGGSRALSGSLGPGDLIAFVYYAVEIQEHIRRLLDTWTEVSAAKGACQRVFDTMQEAPDESQHKRGQREVTVPHTVLNEGPNKMIRFRNVTYSYQRKVTSPSVLALDGISFDIHRGQTVALVGPSGGGKSTIINLMMRFLDPSSGSVEVAGIDSVLWDKPSLRSCIGWVNQQPRLIPGTVMENIAYGADNASTETCKEASRISGADEFISKLPLGYQQKLGRGSNLSGGQIARLCLARALARKPSILLLDEVSSALDAVTEERMTKALSQYVKSHPDVTSVFIAHRLSTVRNADVIYVLKNGRILAQGTHLELMKNCELYKDMCHKQGLHD